MQILLIKESNRQTCGYDYAHNVGMGGTAHQWGLVWVWWIAWNVNILDNIKQYWTSGGGEGRWMVGFWPNILSTLVLIKINIGIKPRL